MSVEPAVSGNSKYVQVMQATAVAKAKTPAQDLSKVQVRTQAKPGTIPGYVGSSTITTYPKLDTFSLGGKIDIHG